MPKLPNDVEALKKLVYALMQENEELRRRLGLNSQNSSKPPSSDGYKKKTTKPAFPKKEGLKNGGQVGHQGKTLERVPHPDKVQVHRPERCDRCGEVIDETTPAEVMQTRQVFDLPEPKLEVTEHRILRVQCPCGKQQTGQAPPDVTASVQYGAGVRALCSLLSAHYKIPLEKISEFFHDLVGVSLNSQTILETLERTYHHLEPLEANVRQQLLASDVVHFDETGIRVNGKLYWHTASDANWTHLFVHEKRGKEAMESEASILPEFTGRAVHDCWASYFNTKQSQHALCGAHLLRELKGLMEHGRLWAKDMHGLLMRLYKDSPPRPADRERILKEYGRCLQTAHQEEPLAQRCSGQRGKVKQTKGRNLADRLKKHRDSVLAFAFEAEVPFTNNQAERDLRNLKVKQKVSGGFRTVEGAQIHARLQAAISTFRKQNLPVFSTCRNLFLGRPPPVAWG